MGAFINWLMCGDPDGLEHKKREEFKQKFPYETITGVLGGNIAAAMGQSLTEDFSARQDMTSEQRAAYQAIRGEYIAAHARTKVGDWTWSLANKQTGQQEEVEIKLDIPAVEFPDIDIPPCPANRIRPIRDLVNRFIPIWYWDSEEGKSKPSGTDFFKAAAHSLYGKTFTFTVTGIEQLPVPGWYGEYRKCVLNVRSQDLEVQILVKLAEFRKELDAVKAAFPAQKAADEALFANGAGLTGRIAVAGGDCSRVELDGVNAYTVKLLDGDKLKYASGNVADAAKEIRAFTVDSLDKENLTVVVSSPQVEELIEMVRREEKELERRAAMPQPNEVLEGKPVLIDGSNVVLTCPRTGWRGLKTLLDWLKRNGVDYYLYFDASIKYKKMDAAGKAFINAQIDDLEHTTVCPSRDEADKFILFRADRTGSHVISDDGYSAWDKQYPWIDAKNHTDDIRRIHKFTEEPGNILFVPDLGIWEKIAGVVAH